MADALFAQRMQRVEALLREIEAFGDGRPREAAREVVQALMDLHGAGIAAMLDLAATRGEAGRAVVEAYARDELVSSLLLLYELHPLGLEERVRAALETARPTLREHKSTVELLSVADGAVRVLVRGDDGNSPSTARDLRAALEEAIAAGAPDVASVVVVGPDGAEVAPALLVPLPLVNG